MAGDFQPLDQKFAIVDNRGQPTEYFIRWAQQRQIDITGAITAEQLPQLIEEFLNDLSGQHGAILYRDATAWAALAPGAAGQVLETNGPGADPSWANPTGVSSGNAFPGAPVDNDLFLRTDRGVLYYYSAALTLWLSVQQFTHTTSLVGDFAASTTSGLTNPYWNLYDIYVHETVCATQAIVAGTWTISPFTFNGAVFAALGAAFSTAGDPLTTYVTRRNAVNAVVANAIEAFQINWTRTGGTIRGSAGIRFRLVG